MPIWLRSVLSVVTGFVTFYVIQGACTFAGTKVFHRSFDYPTTGYLIVAVAYTLAAALIGGYVAARLAPRSPVAHGVVMAVLMLPLMILNLNKGLGSQETPFVVIRSLSTPLFAIVGAALEVRRRNKVLS